MTIANQKQEADHTVTKIIEKAKPDQEHRL